MMDQQHFLYQIANTLFCLGYLLQFSTPKVMTVMRAFFMFGYLIYCYWSWNIICSSHLFAWNFVFVLINLSQMLYAFYKAGPLKLGKGLCSFYDTKLRPLQVDITWFQKFGNPHSCYTKQLKPGETYALRNFTVNDKLSILLTGRATAFDQDNKLLYHIYPCEFLDSAEYQSVKRCGDDKFQVSIFATQRDTSYVCWDRKAVEHHFMVNKLSEVAFNFVMNRDVVDKLYRLNESCYKRHSKSLDLSKDYLSPPFPLDLRIQLLTSLTSSSGDLKNISLTAKVNDSEPIINKELLEHVLWTRYPAFNGTTRYESPAELVTVGHKDNKRRINKYLVRHFSRFLGNFRPRLTDNVYDIPTEDNFDYEDLVKMRTKLKMEKYLRATLQTPYDKSRFDL